MVADPSIGVGDLMTPIKNLLSRTAERDLLVYLKPPFGAGWKSAIPVGWICTHSTLFSDYISLAKNTLVSSKKHKSALEKLDSEEGIMKGKKLREDGVELLDDWLRMGLSHIRQCRQVEDLRSRAQKRCSAKEWETFENLLALVDLGAHEASGSTAMVPYVENKDKDQKGEDVPLDDSQQSSLSQPSSSKTNTPKIQMLPAYTERIFDKVLQKNMSDPKTPEMEKSASKSQQKTQEKGDELNQPFLCKLEAASGDDELLASAEGASPLHNGKSQQQRWNAIRKAKNPKKKPSGQAKPEKGKGKGGKAKGGKGKGKGKKEGKGQKKNEKEAAEEETPANTDSQKTEETPANSEPRQSPIKRKNSQREEAEPTEPASPCPKAMKAAPKAKTPKAGLAAKKKPAEKPKINAKATDDLDPTKRDERNLLRKRLVSRAWHKKYDSEVAKGIDKEKAKEEARASAKACGQKFDEKHPRLPPAEDVN